ncbi:hypothetical protein HLY00_4218 [Mycolicibacterium hippocampi]|uniref:Uncharacterized protein n=1 Tax=Mycolicibacterium hippocampi TaxID=659824 RepID=A0A850PPY3_9MYCO|nr:hypothetical protein [Mycolicibacterium hippocampi]
MTSRKSLLRALIVARVHCIGGAAIRDCRVALSNTACLRRAVDSLVPDDLPQR